MSFLGEYTAIALPSHADDWAGNATPPPPQKKKKRKKKKRKKTKNKGKNNNNNNKIKEEKNKKNIEPHHTRMIKHSLL